MGENNPCYENPPWLIHIRPFELDVFHISVLHAGKAKPLLFPPYADILEMPILSFPKYRIYNTLYIYLSAFLTIVVKLLKHYSKEAAYGKILPIAKTVD